MIDFKKSGVPEIDARTLTYIAFEWAKQIMRLGADPTTLVGSQGTNSYTLSQLTRLLELAQEQVDAERPAKVQAEKRADADAKRRGRRSSFGRSVKVADLRPERGLLNADYVALLEQLPALKHEDRRAALSLMLDAFIMRQETAVEQSPAFLDWLAFNAFRPILEGDDWEEALSLRRKRAGRPASSRAESMRAYFVLAKRVQNMTREKALEEAATFYGLRDDRELERLLARYGGYEKIEIGADGAGDVDMRKFDKTLLRAWMTPLTYRMRQPYKQRLRKQRVAEGIIRELELSGDRHVSAALVEARKRVAAHESTRDPATAKDD